MKKSALIVIVICVSLFLTTTRASAYDMKDMKTIGVLLNYDMPQRNLDNGFNSSYGGGLKIGYGISNTLGTEFAFTGYNFDGKGAIDDLTIECLRLNIFYRFITTTNFYPFATCGIGYYMPDGGTDDLGLNLGLGIISDLKDISDMLSSDLSFNYHNISNTGTNSTFYEIRLGINFNFY